MSATAVPFRAPSRSSPRPALPEGRARRPGEASFFFYDAHFGSQAVKVLPGEHFVHDADIVIATTLGSCIAACLWDRERRVGGMNHFLLPEVEHGAGASGRYGAYAMELLVNELLARGASRAALEAKVFGGAQLFGGCAHSSVGARNTEFVLEYLRTERIPVLSKDVLGAQPRKVCFLPASGRALVKRLASAAAATLVVQERAAAAREAPPGGSVDLF